MKQITTYTYIFGAVVLCFLVPIALVITFMIAEFLICLISVKFFNKELPRWLSKKMNMCFLKLCCMMFDTSEESCDSECIICKDKFKPKDLASFSDLDLQEQYMVQDLAFETGEMFVNPEDFVCGNDLRIIQSKIEGQIRDQQFDGDPSFDNNQELKCDECGKSFTALRSLQRHKVFRCPQQQNIDPIELQKRRATHWDENHDYGIEAAEEAIYVVDPEMEKYIGCVSNNFSRFKICEKLKTPLGGFWPCCFDYRSKQSLMEVTENMSTKESYENIKMILTDGWNIFGERSISFSSKAHIFKNMKPYDISNYRIPVSHLICNVRSNRPAIQVDISGDRSIVTLSFSKEYMHLLPASLYRTMQDIRAQESSTQNSLDNLAGIDEMFSQNQEAADFPDIISDLSQNLSQASLVSKHEEEMDQSPIPTRPATGPAVTASELRVEGRSTNSGTEDLFMENLPSVKIKEKVCPFCAKTIKGNIGCLNRHIDYYCQNKPRSEGLEAEAGRKRFKR